MSAIRSVISSQPPVPGKCHSWTPALLSDEVQENIVLLLPSFHREDTEVLGLEGSMGNQDPRCHEALVELRGSSELTVTLLPERTFFSPSCALSQSSSGPVSHYCSLWKTLLRQRSPCWSHQTFFGKASDSFVQGQQRARSFQDHEGLNNCILSEEMYLGRKKYWFCRGFLLSQICFQVLE